jgi:hypothetical protein
MHTDSGHTNSNFLFPLKHEDSRTFDSFDPFNHYSTSSEMNFDATHFNSINQSHFESDCFLNGISTRDAISPTNFHPLNNNPLNNHLNNHLNRNFKNMPDSNNLHDFSNFPSNTSEKRKLEIASKSIPVVNMSIVPCMTAETAVQLAASNGMFI